GDRLTSWSTTDGSRCGSHWTGTMRGDGRDEGGGKRRREDEASPAARSPRAPSSAPARNSLVREQERGSRRPMSAVGWGSHEPGGREGLAVIWRRSPMTTS